MMMLRWCSVLGGVGNYGRWTALNCFSCHNVASPLLWWALTVCRTFAEHNRKLCTYSSLRTSWKCDKTFIGKGGTTAGCPKRHWPANAVDVIDPVWHKDVIRWADNSGTYPWFWDRPLVAAGKRGVAVTAVEMGPVGQRNTTAPDEFILAKTWSC